jgi:putative transposase
VIKNNLKYYKDRIYKTVTIPVNCSKENLNYLFQCNQESARIWNDCIKISKETWEKEQKYVNQNYFQQVFKLGYSKFLTSKSMQLISKKYLSCCRGIKEARKIGRLDCKYPYKKKKNFNTIYDYSIFQIDYYKGIIKLSKPRIISENNKQIVQKPIIMYVKNVPKNVITIEVKYDNGLKLCLNYYKEKPQQEIIKQKQNICGVDIGEIHSIASIDNEGNNTIITARKIRSIQRFRNKELAKLNSKLSKCTKGSINYKKYRKAIRKLCSKSNAKLNYLFHKTSKLFIDYVSENNINNVIIGDLTNFNMNLKNIKKKKGKQQKLAQWPHGKLREKLQYKLKYQNVNLIEISEKYTSQTCPVCGHRHKPMGRNYVCKCGYKNHRDIVGAINILSKYINGEIKPINLPHKELKYLRIV